MFTTLYWLTCPLMRRHIGRYESAGWISRLEETCKQDAEMKEDLNRLHLDYANRRQAAVRRMNSDPASSMNPNITASLGQTGIAGVADPSRVKCLHAHAAYHLVRDDHPFFKTFPELLADESSCRECESLTGARDAGLHAS